MLTTESVTSLRFQGVGENNQKDWQRSIAIKTAALGITVLALQSLANMPTVMANPCSDCLSRCFASGAGHATCAAVCAPVCGGNLLVWIVRKVIGA